MMPKLTEAGSDDWIFQVRCRQHGKRFTRYMGVSARADEDRAVALVLKTVRPPLATQRGETPEVLDMSWCRMHEYQARGMNLAKHPRLRAHRDRAQYGDVCKSR